MESLSIFMSLIAVVATALLWYRRRKWTFQFPGPSGFPLLGNVPQINALHSHITFYKWWQKYGPVYLIRIFSNDVLIVNDLSLVHEGLLKRGKEFAGRPRYFRTAYITDNCEDIAFHQPDATWRLMRKTAHRCVKMYDLGLARIEEISMDIVGELVADLQQHEGRALNPKPCVYNAVMNVICVLLLGRKYTRHDDLFSLFIEVDQLAMTTAANGGKGSELDVFPFLRFFGNETYRKLRKLRAKRKLLSKMLREDAMVESGGRGGGKGEAVPRDEEEEESPGVVKTLMKLQQTTGLITETNVDCAAFDLILAGTSTTTNSCLCLLNLLANHPRVQAKLHAQIDDVIGARAVTLRDRERLPYVQATLFEVLRLTSLLPLGLPHQTIEDTQIDGKHVPRGVHVFFNLWALHHNEAVYPEPWSFNPDRFIDDVTGKLHGLDHPVRRNLCPFGAGPRVCFGEILARTRMFLIVTTLVQKFEVTQDGDCEKAPWHPEQLRAGIVLGCPDYTLKLTSRDGGA